MVALLASKPATYFPRWFVTTWMDDIWGYTPDEIRPFPARQLSDRGGVRRRLAGRQPRHQHRVPRRQRGAGPGRRAARRPVWPRPRRRWPAWSSRCCRCRPSRWPGSPDAWTRCRRASSWRRSCCSCAGAARARGATTAGRSRWCAVALLQQAEHGDPGAVPGGLRPAWSGGERPRSDVDLAAAVPPLRRADARLPGAALRPVRRSRAREHAHAGQFRRVPGRSRRPPETHGLRRARRGDGRRARWRPGSPAPRRSTAALRRVGARPPGRSAGRRRRSTSAWSGSAWRWRRRWWPATPRRVTCISPPVGWALLVALAVEVAWRQRDARRARRRVWRPRLPCWPSTPPSCGARWRGGTSRAGGVAAHRAPIWRPRPQQAPAGTLVIAGAPRRSFDFAVPHALGPPFTGQRCHGAAPHRHALVDPLLPGAAVGAAHPPAAAGVDRRSGPAAGGGDALASGDRRAARVDDAAQPFIRALVPILAETRDVASLDAVLLDIVEKLADAAGRPGR